MTDHANYRARLGTLWTDPRTQPPTVPTHHGSRATAYSIQSRYEPWAGHWVGRTVAGHSSDCNSTALTGATALRRGYVNGAFLERHPPLWRAPPPGLGR